MTRTPLLGVNLKEMKPYDHTNTCTQLFTALYVIVKSRNDPNVLHLIHGSTKWSAINELMTECCSAVKGMNY